MKGEVLLHLGGADLSFFASGTVFETERGVLTIERFRRHHGKAIAQFAEVTDRTAAEGLRGLPLVGDAPPDEGEIWISDLIGCAVALADGTTVGVVADVIASAVQDRLVVDVGGTEVELPFVEALVPGVDLERRRLVIAPPEGLFPST